MLSTPKIHLLGVGDCAIITSRRGEGVGIRGGHRRKERVGCKIKYIQRALLFHSFFPVNWKSTGRDNSQSSDINNTNLSTLRCSDL